MYGWDVGEVYGGAVMREILFKAKEADSGEWVEGYLVRIDEGIWFIASENDILAAYTDNRGTYDGWMAVIDPDTICQYTGLTDKNGNKIWENDILQIPDDWDNYGFNAGKKYQVFFGYGGFRLKPKNPKFKGFWLDDVEETEVIGNIFDNPELLKAGV